VEIERDVLLDMAIEADLALGLGAFGQTRRIGPPNTWLQPLRPMSE
jgi:hypothetical protein